MRVQVLVNYSAAEVVWVQEEPENQGAWRYVKPRLDTAMRELLPRSGPHVRPAELCTLWYIGRPAAASPGPSPLQHVVRACTIVVYSWLQAV